MSRLSRNTDAVCAQLDARGLALFAEVVREVAEDAGREERAWARETIRGLPENAGRAEALRALDAATRKRRRRA